MTRFARAKGSKASNEKLPEEATSWSEMKQELLNKNKEIAEQKSREEALKKRQDNYKAFLQEKEEEEDTKIAWADFPKAKSDGATPNRKRKFCENSKNNNKKLNLDNEDSEDSDGQFSAIKLQIDKALAKQNNHVNSDSDNAPPEEVSIKQKPQEIVVKKAKKSKQKLKIVVDMEEKLSKALEEQIPKKNTVSKLNPIPLSRPNKSNENLTEKEKKLIAKKQERSKKQMEKKKLRKRQAKELKQNGNPTPELTNSEVKKEINEEKLQRKLERRKRQKEKKLLKWQNAEADKPKLSEEDLKKLNKKREKKLKQIEKRQAFKKEKALKNETEKDSETKDVNENKKTNGQEPKQNYPNKIINNQQPRQEQNKLQNYPKPKQAKPRDNNRDHSRHKQKSEIMFINGKSIEIDYIDGFPVKKDDADRLRKLRKEMISKGLPRSEINAALKLERRRAEKAFAREKKNVCFNCRKSGHNLSECPELEKDQTLAQTAGTGICFKCGSTEHTHFECKVVKGMDYKFATCFICKEQGHISRQCPDNQRGLYPKGGSCKVCGDVTHLKKDCPKYQAQQSQLQSGLSIGTIDSGNPDDFVGYQGANNNNNSGFRRPNKVVKF